MTNAARVGISVNLFDGKDFRRPQEEEEGEHELEERGEEEEEEEEERSPFELPDPLPV